MREEQAATPEQVEAAIDALSQTDLYRLRKFADYKMFLLRNKAGTRTGADLSEAFLRVVHRDRKWNVSKVDFMGFLFGAMESIADSWLREKLHPIEGALPVSALTREDGTGKATNPADKVEATQVQAAQMLIYRETLDQITDLFADDQEIQMVLEAFREGYDPPGVRELWGFSQKQYNTIITRMRRRIESAGITDPRKQPEHVQIQ